MLELCTKYNEDERKTFPRSNA